MEKQPLVPLTDLLIKKTKPREKAFKLYDAGGLFISVRPGGSKLFQMRYQIDGREKLLSFGPYPEVSLSLARERRDDARDKVRQGRDPAVIPMADPVLPQGNPARSFEVIAREWHAQNKRRWGKTHGNDIMESFEKNIFPVMGGDDIDSITAQTLLKAMRTIEERGAIETAHRVRQRCSSVFVHAIASGLCANDPAATVARALHPIIRGRQPALTDLTDARAMLVKVESELCFPITKLASRFLALTSVRPGEIRGAEWVELEDLEGEMPVWRIPPGRMKMKREHLVPLSRQALDVIAVARTLNGDRHLLFPNARFLHKPMSENAIGYLYNRAGYHGRHVPHGWRSTFSSVMNEKYRGDRAIIDLMLAHQSGDKTEAAYNRAEHMERRRELAQIWADMLLEGVKPAEELLKGFRKPGNNHLRATERDVAAAS